MTLKQLISRTNLALDSWPGVEKVNERTCYFYRNQGLLERPLQMGPFAQYGLRHVQQLLAIRALQRQGKSLADVKMALKDLTAQDLTALLRNLQVPEVAPAADEAPTGTAAPLASRSVEVEPYGQVQLAELNAPNRPPSWVCHPVGSYLLIRPPGTPEISEHVLRQIQSLLQDPNPINVADIGDNF